ncbi:MAG: GIY-YIG nuclease family protein [Chlorobi bacterium]|nr:GIY-YIG nuclease family protein [Chlorobiota bacterium]
MYSFYILYSPTLDKYYVGHTSDLAGRLRRHNTRHRGWTGRAGDWSCAYSESYGTKRAAYARERQVKGWKSRKRIEEVVAGRDRGTGHPD